MPDGKLREIEPRDLKPGAVIREISRSSYVRSEDVETKFGTAISPPFADTVVVEDWSDDDSQWVSLERPFARLETIKKSGEPALLLATERFKVPVKRLCGPDSNYRLVCSDRGTPFNIRS